MREVLESLERAGQPSTGPSRADLADAVRQAQQAHLALLLQLDSDELPAEELQILRRHANYLELLAGEVGQDQAGDAYFVAGTIFEWLARLAPSEASADEASTLTRGRVGDLVRASLAYSSGRHEAASGLAARRASEIFLAEHYRPEVLHEAALVILRTLSRDFRGALAADAAYGRSVRAAEPAADRDWAAIGLLSRVAEACAVHAAAMLTGDERLFANADLRVAEAVALAARVGDEMLLALFQRLEAAVSAMRSRSTFQALRTAGLEETLIQWFAGRTPELWSGQAEAVEAGLLDVDRSFVLSLPTGSGKTFLAQLRILATLDRYPDAWVVYVAPTRALVREVYRELLGGLRPHGVRVRKIVASAEIASLGEGQELLAVAAPRTCVVLTPERLDIYVRAQPEIMGSCRLMVIDEAHHLGDPTRGARLETLIGLMRTLRTNVSVLLLSAFMANAAQLAEWLGDASVMRSTVRPTRQLRGICVRYNENQLPNLYLYGTGRNARLLTERTEGEPRKTLASRRSYDVGAVLASRPDDLQPATLSLPGLGAGENWVEARPNGARKEGRTSLTEIAAMVAHAVLNHPGLVLVFLPKTQWAESVARRIAELSPLKEAMAPYARAAATYVGETHPLVYALARAIAYHHSRLPDEVLRIVEAAASAQQLEVLCATSGLQAGVNLPAAVVVVVGDPQPSDSPNPSFRDFANMAGRAGRPGWDTEGLTLYVPPSITRRNRLDTTTTRYLVPQEEDFLVESALAAQLQELLADPRVRPLAELPEQLQQVLLALWASGVSDEEEVRRFLSHLLASPDLAVDPLPALIASSLEDAQAQHPRKLGRFARTALPLSTCLDLDEQVQSLRERSATAEWTASVASQVAVVATLLVSVPFFATRVRSGLPERADLSVIPEVIEAWVAGVGYAAIAGLLTERTGGTFDEARAVSVVTAAAGLLAWGAGSLLSIAAEDEPIVDAEPLLPYFIRFGVSSEVAAYLRLLGVSDRLGTAFLAARYPDDGEAVTLQSVESWTRSPEGRAAIREQYAANPISRLAVETDLGLFDDLTNEPAEEFVVAGRAPEWWAPGTVVDIVDDPDGASAHDLVGGRTWSVVGGLPIGLAVVTDRTSRRASAVSFGSHILE